MLKGENIIAIHRALHAYSPSKPTKVVLDGEEVDIEREAGGFPKIHHAGYTWMKQNTAKRSDWAKRALMGELITWGIPPRNTSYDWIVILGDPGSEESNFQNPDVKVIP